MPLPLIWAIAGHETTTGHSAWTLIDLLTNPDDLAKVRAESERALAGGRLDMAAVKTLAHLNNCVYETERLHPAVPLIVRVASEAVEAYLEIQVLLARLLTRFDLQLLDTPRPRSGAMTKWPASPCRVRYRARTADG